MKASVLVVTSGQHDGCCFRIVGMISMWFGQQPMCQNSAQGSAMQWKHLPLIRRLDGAVKLAWVALQYGRVWRPEKAVLRGALPPRGVVLLLYSSVVLTVVDADALDGRMFAVQHSHWSSSPHKLLNTFLLLNMPTAGVFANSGASVAVTARQHDRSR